jgi:translation initiation factor IF-2
LIRAHDSNEELSSLKRMKDDVSEVRDGVECGIDLAGHKDIRAGDIIETYTTVKLEDELGRTSAELKKQQIAELKVAKDIENEAARAAAQTPPDAANA